MTSDNIKSFIFIYIPYFLPLSPTIFHHFDHNFHHFCPLFTSFAYLPLCASLYHRGRILLITFIHMLTLFVCTFSHFSPLLGLFFTIFRHFSALAFEIFQLCLFFTIFQLLPIVASFYYRLPLLTQCLPPLANLYNFLPPFINFSSLLIPLFVTFQRFFPLTILHLHNLCNFHHFCQLIGCVCCFWIIWASVGYSYAFFQMWWYLGRCRAVMRVILQGYPFGECTSSTLNMYLFTICACRLQSGSDNQWISRKCPKHNTIFIYMYIGLIGPYSRGLRTMLIISTPVAHGALNGILLLIRSPSITGLCPLGYEIARK